MRLIDADALMDSLDSLCDMVCPYSKIQRSVMCGACLLGGAFDVIDTAPTVDPIKHGHWISCDDDGDSPYECSVCGGVKVNKSGEWLDICHQEWSKMPYCSVCGAKMDERET